MLSFTYESKNETFCFDKYEKIDIKCHSLFQQPLPPPPPYEKNTNPRKKKTG